MQHCSLHSCLLRVEWPAEGTRLTCCVCLLSVSATPTHHHGHSCLRLRVYVCCSTGETQRLLQRPPYLSPAHFTPSPLLLCHFISTFLSPPKHTNTQRETETKRGTDRGREKLRSDSLVSERGFSAARCLGKGFDDGVFSLEAVL